MKNSQDVMSRNPKFEIRSSKQIQNSKGNKCSKLAGWRGFKHLNLGFRISNFEFYILLILPLITGTSLLLCSCAVGPNYKRPEIDMPPQYRGAPGTASTNVLENLHWSDLFKEPRLNELLGIAYTNNYDVRIAVARVEQARAMAAQSRSLFFPQVGYAADAARSKNAAAGAALSTGKTGNAFVLDADASWEIDLWGRIRRLNESARAQFLASEEAQRAVTLSVLSEVAQAYFHLLALDAELEIARQSTNSFGESLRIFSQRLEQGVVSKLETSAAQAALSSAAATVPELERQIIAEENLLSVLLGHNPASVQRPKRFLGENLNFTLPPGLPSELLRRRPDVREAEQFLRSANAQVGVAVGDFFPHLTLTALLGQVSPELSAFTAGGANAWSVAANLAGPIFQGGRLVNQYRQAKAAREQSILQYKSTVLNALQEVSDDLVSVEKFGEERTAQATAAEAYRVAVQVSMERYVAGRAGYYEVLQEQQLLFPAERTLVEIKLNQVLSLIQLYQALGGGL